MTTAIKQLRTFVHVHDDIPAFHAAYLVSTFLVAAIFHLGFFAILIALHMCLDYVKYRDFYRFSIPVTIKAMVLESISDIALLLLSLTFAVYLSHEFMLAAVSGLLRSELTLLRAAGTVLPKIKILENVLAAFSNIHLYLHTVNPALSHSLNRLQRWSIILIVLSAALLACSFVLYAGHHDQLLFVFLREMSLSF